MSGDRKLKIERDDLGFRLLSSSISETASMVFKPASFRVGLCTGLASLIAAFSALIAAFRARRRD
jgi:hypothetical protein